MITDHKIDFVVIGKLAFMKSPIYRVRYKKYNYVIQIPMVVVLKKILIHKIS